MLSACGSESTEAPAAAPPADSMTDTVTDAMTDTMTDAVEDVTEQVGAGMAEATGAVEGIVGEANDAMDVVSEPAEGQPAAGEGDPCSLSIEAGDTIAFSTDAMSVPSSCADVTVTLTHTGTMPKQSMGHNWVLLPETAIQEIGIAAARAGLNNNCVPDDPRIVASTEVVGGGESTSVTFSLDALDDGTTYGFACTFPGHWAVMKGTFTVSG